MIRASASNISRHWQSLTRVAGLEPWSLPATTTVAYAFASPARTANAICFLNAPGCVLLKRESCETTGPGPINAPYLRVPSARTYADAASSQRIFWPPREAGHIRSRTGVKWTTIGLRAGNRPCRSQKSPAHGRVQIAFPGQ